MLSNEKKRKIFYTMYWFLLAYTIAAIGWWFYELYHHNMVTFSYRLAELNKNSSTYFQEYNSLIKKRNSNTFQFLGEGIIFLFVIISCALYLFKVVVKELKRNAEQRNFMLAITHELKTPIAVSKLNLETIQKRQLTTEQQSKLVSNTLSETNRLDALCNNLLISYQLGENAFKVNNVELNLSEFVTEIVNTFQSHYPARKINTDIQNQIFVKGDEFLLEIAINNLLENAAKYSPKEKPIYINLSSKNDSAFLEVIDEGEGINAVDKKLVFKKFYRTGNAATQSARGTGLGLYLVCKISRLHDGNITIENNPKGGSIFTFVVNTIT
jgi:two-component system, OmpR family, sensor histidine kinase CiaH